MSHLYWHRGKWAGHKNTFFYLDPPFYHKANRLYRFVFSLNEHCSLQEYLFNLKSPWILSYDNAKEIRKLYDDLDLSARVIDNTYSAHPVGGNSFVGREIIYSNLKKLPLPYNETSNHLGMSIRNFEKDNFPVGSAMKIPISTYGSNLASHERRLSLG